jgi:hypothetical protein
MTRTIYPGAQRGMGTRIAHDPGDPLITSHCPFCGSGQVVGRSDGTIMCDFCGQNYIVRVQPAFPGMPQMPNGPGAPSDIGPDGGVVGPDALGPDGMPMDGGFPPGDDEEDGGLPPGGGEEADDGPPGAAGGSDGDQPPPAGDSKKDDSGSGGKKKPPSKKKSSRSYAGLGGEQLTEDQLVRHLAAALSGYHPAVMARLRATAGSSS